MTERETSRDEQVEKRGSDSPEGKDKDRFDQEVEEAKEEVERLEENPPEKLEEWPTGRAKYETFGGPEHETSYEEAATSKLGPADVRHYPDGTVTVAGEEAEDPEEFKAEPIPGGPTDPDAPKLSGEKDLTKEHEGEKEGEEKEEER